mgnify:CR=1 FL=1
MLLKLLKNICVNDAQGLFAGNTVHTCEPAVGCENWGNKWVFDPVARKAIPLEIGDYMIVEETDNIIVHRGKGNTIIQGISAGGNIIIT